MIAAGIVGAADAPELEEDYNAALKGEGRIELKEEVDIEGPGRKSRLFFDRTDQTVSRVIAYSGCQGA